MHEVSPQWRRKRTPAGAKPPQPTRRSAEGFQGSSAIGPLCAEGLAPLLVLVALDFAIGEALVEDLAGTPGTNAWGGTAAAKPANQYDEQDNQEQRAREHEERAEEHAAAPAPSESPVVHHGDLLAETTWMTSVSATLRRS